MKRILFFLTSLGVISSFNLYSQVAVDNVSADEAVQYLLGPGVEFSNAQFTGDPIQLGYLTGAIDPFEIPSGIILSTDDASNVQTDGGNGGFIATNISNGPDLLDVANSVPPLIGQSFSVSSVNNIAILEFDFVANGQALSFEYIFGSDEYLTYVNSTYNDVFAFFLAGPGITGLYDAPAGFTDGSANIAVIPDSDPALPITISSVNNVLNQEYYYNNPTQTDIALNGYTYTFVASSALVCGATYHIKLAIADGSDQSLKSVVILKEGSFNISNQLIQPIVVNPAPGFPALSVLEGCVDGQFIVSPPSCLVEADTVGMVITGSATLGTDYTLSNSVDLIFQPGGDPVIIDVIPLEDNVAEGLETITLSFYYINAFGQEDTATASLNLIDYLNPSIQPIDELRICPGTTEQALAVVDDGYGPYTYDWSSGETGTSAVYMPGDAGTYSVSILDFCENTAEIEFVVSEPAPFAVQDSVEICYTATSQSLVEGGEAPYTFEFDTLGVNLVNESQFYGEDFGVYPITVTDACDQVDQILAFVIPCGTTIPNIFTPNGDDNNQYFEIVGVERFPGSELTVWNRWGTIVYESSSYRNRWDGDDLPEGTYFYVFKRSDGEISSGYVMILRDK
jgi:gliding motility-associated-like protein